jgi:hypothetical protein
MRSDTSTNGAILSSKSHARPRTLLATTLLYSLFHPYWQTRHGDGLGILALCKAWLPTAYNNNASSSSSSLLVAFGSWLQDRLARSVGVLALDDRFGDFSSNKHSVMKRWLQRCNLYCITKHPMIDTLITVRV